MRNNKAKEILELWKYQEFFSQQPLNKIKEPSKISGKYEKIHIRWNDNETLKSIINRIKGKCQKKLYDKIVVNIGSIRRSVCVDAFTTAVGKENYETIEEDKTVIAPAAIVLNSEGMYIPGEAHLSPICWAIKHLANNQNNIDNAFKNAKKRTDEELIKLFGSSVEAVSGDSDEEMSSNDSTGNETVSEYFISDEAVSYEKIKKAMDIILDILFEKGENNSQCEIEIEPIFSIETTFFLNQKAEETYSEQFSGLCSHYYLKDLEKISRQQKLLSKGKIADYLNALVDGNERNYFNVCPTDISDEYYKKMAEYISPNYIPLGRWPSQYNLSFFQQFAVNVAVSGAYDSLFSVNGPPGTGKTTLLKDIAAANIVEKAAVLARFDSPDDAFEKHTLQAPLDNGRISCWYSFTKKMQDANLYSMLVVSNNNTAVENISKEWPLQEELLKNLDNTDAAVAEIRDLFDANKSVNTELLHVFENNQPTTKKFKDLYFTEYAKRLIHQKSDTSSANAWGMVSAALGKRANINQYSQILRSIGFDFGEKAVSHRTNHYSEYREKFLAQYEKVKSLKGQLDFISAAEQSLQETESSLSAVKKKREEIENEIASIEKGVLRISGKYTDIDKISSDDALSRLQENQLSLDELDQQADSLDRQMNQLKSSVGFFQRLFKTKAYQENLAEQEKVKISKEELQTKREAQAAVCQAAKAFFDDAKELDALETRKTDCEKNLAEKNQKTRELEKQKSDLAQKRRAADNGESGSKRALSFNKAYVKALLSEKETDAKRKAQKSVPWITDEFNREREKLFYYALNLTKEFIVNSKALKTNFKIFEAYSNPSERKNFLIKDINQFIVPVFQCLFLLTPVISSTLASVAKLFDHVSEPDVIGYLLIDEAGQAVPYSVLGAIYRARRVIATGDPKQIYPVVTDDMLFINRLHSFENTARYNSKTISAQNFIDQLNPFGTIIDSERVGCPLVVHRRCASPMFDICNQISYGDTMINSTIVKKPSVAKWIQCVGKEKGGRNHFVPQQGDKVCELLKQRFYNNPDEKIFIISPFNSVVDGIKQAVRSKKLLSEKVSIGTVHTFQGKEAETVIFVLGCDRKTSDTTKKFVDKNIVNVAASRAKVNFFVVGDAQAWAVNEYITRMKSILDVHAIKLANTTDESQLRESSSAILESLPNAFSAETADIFDENSSDGADSIINTSAYTKELKKVFGCLELSPEEMSFFNLDENDLSGMSNDTKKNLILGVKLYGVLRRVYESYHASYGENRDFDATCCSVLFCKFLENFLKDTLLDTLKTVCPDFKIKRKGNLILSNISEEMITMGSFVTILKKYNSTLGNTNLEIFTKDLSDCVAMRNHCCHLNIFPWKGKWENNDGQDVLLSKMFGIKNQYLGVFQRISLVKNELSCTFRQ